MRAWLCRGEILLGARMPAVDSCGTRLATQALPPLSSNTWPRRVMRFGPRPRRCEWNGLPSKGGRPHRVVTITGARTSQVLHGACRLDRSSSSCPAAMETGCRHAVAPPTSAAPHCSAPGPHSATGDGANDVCSEHVALVPSPKEIAQTLVGAPRSAPRSGQARLESEVCAGTAKGLSSRPGQGGWQSGGPACSCALGAMWGGPVQDRPSNTSLTGLLWHRVAA